MYPLNGGLDWINLIMNILSKNVLLLGNIFDNSSDINFCDPGLMVPRRRMLG